MVMDKVESCVETNVSSLLGMIIQKKKLNHSIMVKVC